jgi:CcmD family protein
MADPGIPYLGAAFGIAWVAMAAYLVRLARAQRDIDRRLSDRKDGREDVR